MSTREWDALRHFKKSEWGRNPDKVDWDLVTAIDELRELSGVPIHIHCAWDDRGHSPNSQHYLGKAVDLHFDSKYTPLQEFQIILASGRFGGVGWYPAWKPRPGWHLDIRPTSVRWVEIDKRYVYGEELLRAALQKF